MRVARSIAVTVATVLAVACHALDVPRVLIYQEQEPSKDQADMNLQLADLLAQEFDTRGAVEPVVWSMTDPVFRDALLSKSFTSAPTAPTMGELFAGADRLHAVYVVWVKATITLKGGKGKLRLFRSHREIWKDEKNMTAGAVGQTNELDTARSMARTWASLISSGPFKSLPAHPKVADPGMSPGQEPPKIPVQPTPPVILDAPPKGATAPVLHPVDNTQLKRDISALIAGGRRTEAILRMRDAVDLEPLDLPRRLMLIDALIPFDPSSAASEARRVANLMPDHPELRVLSARAWLRAGDTTEARQDLNEAMARDPNGAPTRLLLAELSLQEGKAQEALEDVAPILAAGPNAEARYLRALARALIGGADGAQQDLAEYAKLQPEPSPDEVSRHYALAVDAIDAATKKAFDDEKEFLRKAALRPKDQAVQDQADQLARQAQAGVAFMGTLSAPLGHRTSHERRLLGLRLFVQSISDGQRYLASQDEDTLSDARMNLGEAVKHLAAAHEAFIEEAKTVLQK